MSEYEPGKYGAVTFRIRSFVRNDPDDLDPHFKNRTLVERPFRAPYNEQTHTFVFGDRVVVDGETYHLAGFEYVREGENGKPEKGFYFVDQEWHDDNVRAQRWAEGIFHWDEKKIPTPKRPAQKFELTDLLIA